MILFVLPFFVLCVHMCFLCHQVNTEYRHVPTECRHALGIATYPQDVTKLPARLTDVTTCAGVYSPGGLNQ
jgi:hypothetical protein